MTQSLLPHDPARQQFQVADTLVKHLEVIERNHRLNRTPPVTRWCRWWRLVCT